MMPLLTTYAFIFVSVLMNRGICKELPKPEIDYQQLGADQLKAVENIILKRTQAKNVILFIGDGMGISAITAGRILQGQLKGKSGEENQLFFEKFPHVALSKTYDNFKQVGDSASTATSIMSGEKVNYNTVGVSRKVNENDCQAASDNTTWLTSIADLAQQNNLGTGFVTTVRVTHATPAAIYAHSASRYWEGNLKDAKCPKNIKDIGIQLVEDETAKNLKVVMGGGRAPMGNPKDNTEQLYDNVKRKDGRNLVEEWKKDRENRKIKYKYVDNLKDLKDIDVNSVDHIMGLFHDDYLSPETDKPQTEPTLTDMIEVAINLLKKEKHGYFLMVEGGQIDEALHRSEAQFALHELLALDKAVAKASEMTDPNETLIIVTADHSHTLTISGHAKRGNDILGNAGNDADGIPYSTLSFANGPGYAGKYEVKQGEQPAKVVRATIAETEVIKPGFKYLGAVNMLGGTHGGEDVAIFAQGPKAHYIHGVQEESYISHVMQYALCIHPVVKCGAMVSADIFTSLIGASVIVALYAYIRPID